MAQTTPADQAEPQAERDLVAEMVAIRARIAERTTDLTDEQRQELADCLAREVMDAVVAKHKQRWGE